MTNSTLTTVLADQRGRDHAIIEQVIAELKDGPLAHLPSGHYAANAAWVGFAALTFNLARAASIAPGMVTARWATLRRRRIITVRARLASTGRRIVLHLPARWPWVPAWAALWDAAIGPPPATT
ncbi:transposase [Cellulomonas sp. KRMCY2]|uniref:transposase n=1 Tax=Cellulomonas sp. KRMCY2 TaxID=1304865 RepID=UPI0012DD819E|nr:transposase [Cellulomonas sp. KRMCY2]